MPYESPDIIIYDGGGTGNTATVTAANAIKVDGSAVTQPVSISATVTVTDASIGSNAAAVPSSSTLAGGYVTTAVESGLTSGNMYPLSLTTAGLLRIDGSNVTQPVSQSGTWTVQPGNTANTTPWLITINQGGNSAIVKAASTAAAAADPALVVAISPNNSLSVGQGTSPWVTNITQFGGSNIVTGTGNSGAGIPRVTVSADSNVGSVQSGTWVVSATQTTATNLNALVSQGPANTLANAWSTKLTDGTNGPAAVKAASTAAVAADQALVVAINPTSQVANTTGTLGALNATVPLTLPGGISSAYARISGTWVGTIQFQGSVDGTNFVPLEAVQGGPTSVYTAAGFTANGGVRIALPAAFTIIQAIMTAYTSGTATVVINATVGTANIETIQFNAANLLASVGGLGAAGSAVTGNPVLIAGENIGTGLVEPLGSVIDRSAMTAGSQTGVPIIGQSYGVGRIARVSRLGHMNPGYQTLLAIDPVEGTTVNSWLWTQSTTTMTIAQTGGLLTLNSGAITTTITDAIITTNKQFPLSNQSPIGCSFKALVTQGTNSVNELGFGAPVGTTATINNGAFFRINASGTILAVTSTGGTETVSASLGTIVTTSYYLFYVVIEDGGARFFIESETGVPLVDYFAPLTLATPSVASAVSHLPAFARVYTTGAASTAPQTKIAAFQAWQYEINTSKPWSEQLGTSGRQSNISPTAFTQTYNGSLTANPTAVTPTNGTAAFTTLGGTFSLNMTATSGNILSVFSYQVPSPYSLAITEIFMPPPSILTTFSGATPTVQNWYLILANNATLSSSTTTYIHPLGSFGNTTANNAVGNALSGQPLQIFLKTPILAQPGVYVFIGVRIVNGAATGSYTGNILINGYFE